MPYIVKIMPSKIVPSRGNPNPPIKPSRSQSRGKNASHVVAVVAYDGVSAFELGFTLEVFGLSQMGPDWYRVVVCAERPGQPLKANEGLKVIADTGLSALARADTIIVPGSREIVEASPVLLDALKREHRRGARVASICAGAFILAAAGLLDGRRATAHWAHTDTLSRRYPRVQVDANVLYVDDGDIMTSAGRAAGLDLCLHIVRRDHGAEVANQVARRLVIAPHREGGQAQYIRQPVPPIEGDALAVVFEWAQRHLDRDLTISSLAAKARMSRRTFIRRFEDATGMSPGEWVVQTRVAKARELLEATKIPIESVATETGFGSADAMRHHFRLRLGTSPANYRAAFRVPLN
jgi:AraC family transcriptional regulator, transcriptional activator FtrA